MELEVGVHDCAYKGRLQTSADRHYQRITEGLSSFR